LNIEFPDQVQFVTLLTFDSGYTTWHYDDTPALKTRGLSWRAYNPGGGTAHSFAIDEHLEFHQDIEGTRAMFARERRSRERYNCCVAKDAAMPVGSFFEED
jgi:hypothetical protein